MLWRYTVRRAGQREDYSVEAPTKTQAIERVSDLWMGSGCPVNWKSFELDGDAARAGRRAA